MVNAMMSIKNVLNSMWSWFDQASPSPPTRQIDRQPARKTYRAIQSIVSCIVSSAHDDVDDDDGWLAAVEHCRNELNYIRKHAYTHTEHKNTRKRGFIISKRRRRDFASRHNIERFYFGLTSIALRRRRWLFCSVQFYSVLFWAVCAQLGNERPCGWWWLREVLRPAMQRLDQCGRVV